MHFEKKEKKRGGEERDKARRREGEKERGRTRQKGVERGTFGWVWCAALFGTGPVDW